MGLEVCLQCGDKGITNAKIYCVKCLEFFVHRYCLDVIPETLHEFVHWFCDTCIKEANSTSLGKREAACQAGTEDLETVKDINNSVNCVGVSEKCIQLEKNKANDILQQQADLLDESYSVQKVKEKRRLIISAREKDLKSPGKELKNIEIKEHAKSASYSILPKEAKEKELLKQRDQRCSSEQPCESNTVPCVANHVISRNGSFKSAKEDAVMSSSDMTDDARSLRPRNETNVRRESRAIVSYHRSNFGETYAKDSGIISSDYDPGACAEPLVTPVWRGSFEIRNRDQHAVDGLMAHPSSKACQKVHDEAGMFETVLQLQMLPRTDVLPKSFQTSEPSGENIALYFFPSNISERVFDSLVDEVVEKELAMKGTMQNAELLLFPSTELPMLYWRFQGKYYIWGVFRAKQLPQSQSQSPVKVRK